ncbi:MAG: neutral/alkaline non-lysosomal ceramidase N-terminal domain-containing protein [Bacteroidota bacterium]|nr:neutral/alkaline non-lysosomal ceramidase N-terminal domain-containing protein [Bacteroidota bacterium]
MWKILKITGKTLGVIAVIIMFALIWGLEKVDYSPYFESDYYQETIIHFDSLSNELSLAEGRVYIGSGKASITPLIGAQEDNSEAGAFKELPLAGFGSRKGTYAEGVHDSLFVKVVAVQVQEKLLLMIGSDMLIVPTNISEGVSLVVDEKLGIKRNQLFFTATHTHSSVGGWADGFVGKQFAGLPNQNIVDWLIRQYSKAIEDAIEDLKPGSIGTGSFEASDLISNRLIGDRGEKNAEFVYIIARQDEGKHIVIGSFGAHATTLGGWNMQISADYPGYWQRHLENHSADMAIFFAGSVGSHSPKSKGDKFKKSEYIGEALADSVLKHSPSVELKDSIKMAFLSLRLNLPELHIRVSDNLRLNPAISSKLLPAIGDTYIQTARIGNLVWSTTPSDFSGEIAITFKNTMSTEGFNALITGFNGNYVGYIIPDKYYHLNEYESRLMSWFGPSMNPYTEEMIRRSMQRIASL